jgi:peptide/nickel transport system permease protein
MARVIQHVTRSPSFRIAAKRLPQAIPVLWGVTFLTFMLMNLLPGGSAVVLAGAGATKAEVADVARRLHLNEPFFVRYWHWLSGATTGHLGTSLSSNEPVSSVIAARLPVTAELVVLAFILSLVCCIPVAILAVRKPHGFADRISIVVSIVGLSVPNFVLGLLLALVFAVHLRLLPALGFSPLSAGLWQNLRTMILPAVTLGFALFCTYTRVLRADLLDQMGEDYIATAKMKGAGAFRVIVRHALRNSMFTLIALIGLNLGTLIGGTVLVEEIFALPGMGQALIEAIQIEDVTVVEAIVVVVALAVVVTNLLTDLLYVVLDPRIRYGSTSS